MLAIDNISIRLSSKERYMPVFSMRVDAEYVSPEDKSIIGALAALPFLVIPHWVGDVFSLEGEVDAPSPIEAMEIFHEGLAQIGLRVMRWDLGLMSVSDIARKLDVSRETVRLWAGGSRRGEFPTRFAHVGSSLVWVWSEVFEWATAQGYELGDVAVPLPLALLEKANGDVARERSLSSI